MNTNYDATGAWKIEAALTIRRPNRVALMLMGCTLLVAFMLPGNASEVKTFNAPQVSGKRLDWCLKWGSQCGKPAADEFCRRQGFASAKSLQQAQKAGPTIVLGTGQACGPSCDSFQFIECETSGSPAGAAATALRDALEVEVRWNNGAPVAGALVVAVRHNRPDEIHGAVTGDKGVATLYLDLGVTYLVFALNFDNAEPFLQHEGMLMEMPTEKGQHPIMELPVGSPK